MNWLIPAAHAADAPAASPEGGFFQFGLLIVMFVVFYFLLIRPQSKRAKEHKKLVTELAKGDEVVTSGGIMGKVTKVVDEFVVVEVANNLEVKIQKQNVTASLPKGTLKQI